MCIYYVCSALVVVHLCTEASVPQRIDIGLFHTQGAGTGVIGRSRGACACNGCSGILSRLVLAVPILITVPGQKRKVARELHVSHPSSRQLLAHGPGPSDGTLPVGCQGPPHEIGGNGPDDIHSPATSQPAPHSLISARARGLDTGGDAYGPAVLHLYQCDLHPGLVLLSAGFGLPNGTLHRPCPSLIKQPRPPTVHLMLPLWMLVG